MPKPPSNDLADKPGAEIFKPLPASEISPSLLDENPRYLRLQNFASQFLDSPRDVVVYLPEAYFTDPNRRFPVFYLHDGQNLFDGRTSYIDDRTWQAGTTADALTEANRIEPIILVGVDNTGLHRMADYTPTRDKRLGGGDGALYGRLLVEELKPLIDRSFRTRTGPQDTALGGSSLGGLITLELGLRYPQVFGKLAVLSPSVWWNQRSILARVAAAKPKPALKIWLDMGMSEGLRHLRDTDLLHKRLTDRGWQDGIDLRYLRIPGGLHEEGAWAARFDQVLRFLFPTV